MQNRQNRQHVTPIPGDVICIKIAKIEYVANYYMCESIQLDPAHIEKNLGRCTLAKVMLNSMWGKFGQKPNETQVREFDYRVKFSEYNETNKYAT